MNNQIRSQFPALQVHKDGQPIVYLDGPAGTQVPTIVTGAIQDYYDSSNANTHGYFGSSQRTDELLSRTRDKAATFLNAASGDCISFGANMTTLNYSLSRGLGRSFSAGDEIIISQLDHESNRGPWLALEELGIKVKEIALKDDGTLDYDNLPDLFTDRTRLVAVGVASNIFGTLNDISRIRAQMPPQAKLLVDAVHYAPHFSIDVQALDCDFLLCSAYKFYGPHVGILYCKPGLLDSIPVDRLRTQEQSAPYCIETGTLNHAAIAGVEAALDFIAMQGQGSGLREKIVSALEQFGQHESNLMRRLAKGINDLHGYRIWGPNADHHRAPTLAITSPKFSAEEICRELGSHGINAWDGHFYAIRAAEVLGLLESGGVTRMGMSIYNTEEEIDRTLDVLQRNLT